MKLFDKELLDFGDFVFIGVVAVAWYWAYKKWFHGLIFGGSSATPGM